MIPDREVLVRYADRQSRAMVPAFLLCMTSADNWVRMIGNKERESTWKPYAGLDDVGVDNHDSSAAVGASC